MSEKLIEKIVQECPICNQAHLVEKWEIDSEAVIKDTNVKFQEIVFRCTNIDDEENEFVPGGLMSENLLRARNAYRQQMGLLTSSEIAEIRGKYGLTQADFAFLMGWGEITVTRYESKTIQDETYDEMMRMVNHNPLFALENLERHKNNFTAEKYSIVHERILKILEDSNNSYMKQQEIKSLYLRFRQIDELNGNKLLDLNMLEKIIGYFAIHVQDLFKVKLMKLLWYADTLAYKQDGVALTGLVYQHKPYGALPIGYNELIYLPTIDVEEIQSRNGNIIYKIFPAVNMESIVLPEHVQQILDFVVDKFKDFSTQEIVDYMHEEKAYKETINNQPISFSYAQFVDENRMVEGKQPTEIDGDVFLDY